MLSGKTIERVKEEVNISDVVSSYTNLSRVNNHELKGLCPFHNDKNPSFFVNEDKGVYNCFGCQQSGNTIGFVMEKENLDFEQSVRMLADEYDIKIEEKQMTSSQENEIKILDIIDGYSSVAGLELLRNNKSKPVLDEVLNRGIDEEAISKYGIGYASPGSVEKYFKANDVNSLDDKLRTKLIGAKDDGSTYQELVDRVTFPLRDIHGNIVGLSGREREKHKTGKKYKIATLPIPAFFYDRLKSEKDIYLVEGFFDVISLDMAGIMNSISAMGTSLSDAQAKALLEKSNKFVFVMDGDEPGLKSMEKLAEQFDNLDDFNDIQMKFVLLPDNLDVDDYRKKYGNDALHDYVESNQLDRLDFEIKYRLETAKDAKTRNSLVLLAIDQFSDGSLERSQYLSRFAKSLGVDSSILEDELVTLNKRNKNMASNNKDTEATTLFDSIELEEIDKSTKEMDIFESSRLAKYEAILVRYLKDNPSFRERYDDILIHDYAKSVLDGHVDNLLEKLFDEKVNKKDDVTLKEMMNVVRKIEKSGKTLKEIEDDKMEEQNEK